MEMIQIYNQCPMTENIETVNGMMLYGDWLQQEADRINADPVRRAEVRKNGVRASLWVNDVTGNG